MKNDFKGTITELITPYNDDFSVDYDALVEQIEFQINSDIGGLFVNGLPAECLYLSEDINKELLKFTVETVKGRLPVMGNVVFNATDVCVDVTKSFEADGADAICITQPSTCPLSEEAMYNHFTAIIRATKLPVCIYNAPQTNNIMSPGLVIRLINENENVTSYKESTLDMIHTMTIMRNVKRSNVDLISGSDGTVLPIMQMGGVGVISLISVVFPQAINNICNACFANEKEKAIQTQYEVLAIRDALKTAPFVAGYKYAADLVGAYPGGKVKPPLVDATDKQRAHIKAELQKLGLVK